MTDNEVKAALPELFVVALTLFGEADREPIEGKVFVGSVIRTRVETPRRFSGSYAGVCLARLQFSCWWAAGGPSNYARVMALARRLVGDHLDQAAAVKDPAWTECCFVAEGIIGGQLRDRAKGANHYLTKTLYRTAPPAWARGRQPVVEVGAHLGFRL